MANTDFGQKIQDLRKQKGFSQERLSEDSQLSLRTIQRIENGETYPRGDTLLRLTTALEVSPDDIMEWAPQADSAFLKLLNLSGLALLFHPLLGIILPLVLWIYKKDKVKLADDTGKKLINFQITWVLIIQIAILSISQWQFYLVSVTLWDAISGLTTSFVLQASILLALFLYDAFMIFYNLSRNQKELKARYFPAIPFLR